MINSGPGISRLRQASGIAAATCGVIGPSGKPHLECQKGAKRLSNNLWRLEYPAERLRKVKDHC